MSAILPPFESRNGQPRWEVDQPSSPARGLLAAIIFSFFIWVGLCTWLLVG